MCRSRSSPNGCCGRSCPPGPVRRWHASGCSPRRSLGRRPPAGSQPRRWPPCSPRRTPSTAWPGGSCRRPGGSSPEHVLPLTHGCGGRWPAPFSAGWGFLPPSSWTGPRSRSSACRARHHTASPAGSWDWPATTRPGMTSAARSPPSWPGWLPGTGRATRRVGAPSAGRLTRHCTGCWSGSPGGPNGPVPPSAGTGRSRWRSGAAVWCRRGPWWPSR